MTHSPAKSSFEAGFYPNYTGTLTTDEGTINVFYQQVDKYKDVYVIYSQNNAARYAYGAIGVINTGDTPLPKLIVNQNTRKGPCEIDGVPANTLLWSIPAWQPGPNICSWAYLYLPNYRPIPGLYPWCKHSRFIVEYYPQKSPFPYPQLGKVIRLDCKKAHYDF